MRQAILSIASKKYLASTLLALESFTRHNPGWDPWLLLADESEGLFRPEELPVPMIQVDELGLPDAAKYKFRYNEGDFCISLKPAGILHLLEAKGYDRVIYLDGDTFSYSRFDALERILDSGVQVVFSPHLIRFPNSLPPYEDEKAVIMGGTYNLGFLAVNRGTQSLQMLRWWAKIMETQSYKEYWTGSRDQKWINLVPGMFESHTIQRDPGYNVATWNLRERGLSWQDGNYLCCGEPLAFFHFSRFDPKHPKDYFMRHLGLPFEELGELGRLPLEYAEVLNSHPFAASRGWTYAYGRFSDSSPIPETLRWRYRASPSLQRYCGEQPFEKRPFLMARVYAQAFIWGFIHLFPASLRSFLMPEAQRARIRRLINGKAGA